MTAGCQLTQQVGRVRRNKFLELDVCVHDGSDIARIRGTDGDFVRLLRPVPGVRGRLRCRIDRTRIGTAVVTQQVKFASEARAARREFRP